MPADAETGSRAGEAPLSDLRLVIEFAVRRRHVCQPEVNDGLDAIEKFGRYPASISGLFRGWSVGGTWRFNGGRRPRAWRRLRVKNAWPRTAGWKNAWLDENLAGGGMPEALTA